MLRLTREQKFVLVQRAWGFIDIMQGSCSCALHTNKGDLNKGAGAVDWQADQRVVADFGLKIPFNVEFNSQFKGDRNHHFDVVSGALCRQLQSNVQHIIRSVSCVKIRKLPLNKGGSKS